VETLKNNWEILPHDDGVEIKNERPLFGLAHTEVGSLVLFNVGFLKEYEAVVDFHHDFSVLKARNEDLFLLTLIINLADRLALLLQTGKEVPEHTINQILQPKKEYFPLTTHQIQQILITLRAKGLVS